MSIKIENSNTLGQLTLANLAVRSINTDLVGDIYQPDSYDTYQPDSYDAYQPDRYAMKKWNWREEQRSRRRHGGHRHDWYSDNRHRASQDEWYGPNQTGSPHQASQRSADNAVPSSPLPSASSSSASSSSASTSSSSSTSNTAPELPGFYFDPEKNRYFRLLPGHNNCNPLTKEKLQEKEREKQRSKLLLEDDGPRKKAPRDGLNTALLLQKRRLGLLPGSSYCRLVHEVKASGMKRHRLEVQSTDNQSPNRDNFRVIVGDSASERVFTVNDVSHGGCKYGIMNFKGCSRGSLSVEMCDNLYFTNRKVNSICWASVNHPDSHVLYPSWLLSCHLCCTICVLVILWLPPCHVFQLVSTVNKWSSNEYPFSLLLVINFKQTDLKLRLAEIRRLFFSFLPFSTHSLCAFF